MILRVLLILEILACGIWSKKWYNQMDREELGYGLQYEGSSSDMQGISADAYKFGNKPSMATLGSFDKIARLESEGRFAAQDFGTKSGASQLQTGAIYYGGTGRSADRPRSQSSMATMMPFDKIARLESEGRFAAQDFGTKSAASQLQTGAIYYGGTGRSADRPRSQSSMATMVPFDKIAGISPKKSIAIYNVGTGLSAAEHDAMMKYYAMNGNNAAGDNAGLTSAASFGRSSADEEGSMYEVERTLEYGREVSGSSGLSGKGLSWSGLSGTGISVESRTASSDAAEDAAFAKYLRQMSGESIKNHEIGKHIIASSEQSILKDQAQIDAQIPRTIADIGTGLKAINSKSVNTLIEDQVINIPIVHPLQQAVSKKFMIPITVTKPVIQFRTKEVNIPVSVAKPILKKVEKLVMYNVPVYRPVAVPIETKVPVAKIIEKPFYVTIQKPVPVPHYIPKPIPVPVSKEVPYRVTHYKPVIREIEKVVSIPVTKYRPKPVIIHKDVQVPIEKLRKVPVIVTRNVYIPVEKLQRIPFPVNRYVPTPYPVYRRVPVPVNRDVPVSVPVYKPVPYPVTKLVPTPVTVERRIPIIRNIAVPQIIQKHVRVPVYQSITHPVPVYIQKHVPVPRLIKSYVPVDRYMQVPIERRITVPVHIDRIVKQPISRTITVPIRQDQYVPMTVTNDVPVPFVLPRPAPVIGSPMVSSISAGAPIVNTFVRPGTAMTSGYSSGIGMAQTATFPGSVAVSRSVQMPMASGMISSNVMPGVSVARTSQVLQLPLHMSQTRHMLMPNMMASTPMSHGESTSLSYERNMDISSSGFGRFKRSLDQAENTIDETTKQH